MTQILKGKPVTDAILEDVRKESDRLRQIDIDPTLAIIRVGADESDLSYERGASKKAEAAGISIRKFVFEDYVSEKKLIRTIDEINEDDSIHGVLMFRPLPPHIDEDKVRNRLVPGKDVDGITDASLAGIFTGNGKGFAPCTPAACMEMVDFYGIPLSGKKVTIVGRSLVVGRPLAMMMMSRNATVSICHSRTTEEDMRKLLTDADIIVAAAGSIGLIDDKINQGENQVILDVGINVDENGKLKGDVDFDSLADSAKAITPVPGGVGGITSTLLMKHVAIAAGARFDED